MGVRPYSAPSVADTEAWSYSVWSTAPCGIRGETMTAGTRTPYQSNRKPPELMDLSLGLPSPGGVAPPGFTES